MRKLLVFIVLIFPVLLQASTLEKAFNGRITFKVEKSILEEFTSNNLNPEIISPELKENSFKVKNVFQKPSKEEFIENYYNSGMHLWYKMTWNPKEFSLNNVKSILEKSPFVSIVNLEIPIEISLLPDDYNNYSSYALNNLHCEAAWEVHNGADEIVIAVLDSGIEPTHEDLQNQLYLNSGEDLNGNGIWDESDNNGLDDDDNGYIDDIMGYDFISIPENEVYTLGAQAIAGQDYGPADNDVSEDYIGHGTFVAGIAGATTDNGIGVASISWGATIMPLRIAMPAEYMGQETAIIIPSDLAQSVQYATENGADVINMSFGFQNNVEVVETAMSNSYINGVVLVAGTGNFGNQQYFFPAAYGYVIAVAAVDENDLLAEFSNYGTWTTLCVPGVDIVSTTPNYGIHTELYSQHSGTSAASPFVAGAVALLMASEPGISPFLVESRLTAACQDIENLNPGYEGLIGAGRLNLHYLLDPEVVSVDENRVKSVIKDFALIDTWPNPFNSHLNISVNLNQAANTTITVYDISGRKVDSIFSGNLKMGNNSFSWKANQFSSGTYYLAVKNMFGSRMQRITLVK